MTLNQGPSKSYQWSDKLRKFVVVNDSSLDNLVPNKDIKILEKTKQKDNTSEQLDFLQAENETLKIKASAASDQNNQLSAENQLLKSEVRRLKVELEKSHKLNFDKAQMEKLFHSEVDKLKQTASSQVEKMEKEMDEKEEQEALIKKLRTRIHDLENAVDKAYSPAAVSRTIIKFGNDKDAERKLNEYPELKTQIRELEEKVKKLRKEKWDRKEERRYDEDNIYEKEAKRLKHNEIELQNQLLLEKSENRKLKTFIEKMES